MNNRKRKFRYDRLLVLLLLLAISVYLIYSFVNLIVRAVDAILDNEKNHARIASIDDYDKLLPPDYEALSTTEEEYIPLPLIYDDNSAQLGSKINSQYAILYSVKDLQKIQ